MNDLILALYLADVSQNIATILLVLAVFGTIVCCVFAISAYAEGEKMPSGVRYAALIYFVMFLVCALLPNKQFVYIAIALKSGERIAQTDIAKKAMTIIEAKIEEELKKLEGMK